MRKLTVALVLIAVFVSGVSVGLWLRWRKDVVEIARCDEAKRMALDAATAEATLAFPTAHECALSAQDFLSREGYRAVRMEGVR